RHGAGRGGAAGGRGVAELAVAVVARAEDLPGTGRLGTQGEGVGVGAGCGLTPGLDDAAPRGGRRASVGGRRGSGTARVAAPEVDALLGTAAVGAGGVAVGERASAEQRGPHRTRGRGGGDGVLARVGVART